MATISASGHTLDSFNTAPPDRAARDLLACCAVPAWASALVDRRPYPDLGVLLAVADAALAALSWEEVASALAAHPRIGERPAGADRESAWSRREQAGVADADTRTRAELAVANREYEARFGHLFLIFASGRTDTELLAAARRRLRNDDETERRVVHQELRRIARLRLERLLTDDPAESPVRGAVDPGGLRGAGGPGHG
ncbi:2-oxo-4-hydroxy-4-carboxy-5-ureidoimidazoline decarboxylase [Micromonospora pisi]|uniref:2-oxo-4-hydroxy-4-carboxy-5-ureidoimidazoline decarboxylase n=1 Tax=Micromonospora pisi TaxID=589240 RepID=A0A495JSX1_9ACTN|nr:2-oxo-4-hydroxy-4-carboxy-5-ureidoimidazoline decarboxylase [Micromonospora pisi]RKR91462.1 2-oxo-4-hydroxy-4-carboxy-5-ureidoimidazoline decarboxylase [Micromonospora pisi]